jgi:Kef-type K+ transport system membrane component KefB
MIGWTQVLRRHVVSEQTAARIVSMAMYAASLVVVILGIRGVIRLHQNEKELFFGVILVVNLAMTMVLTGFVIDLMTRLAGRSDKPAESSAGKLHSCTDSGRVHGV